MPETQKINRTAILVFANSSKEELEHKAIPKGKILFQGLTERAMLTAKKTGLPYFLITEREQYGNTFGERFVNAISSIYDRGFDNVITIGNDTPQLKVSDILNASKNIDLKKFVLGPSKDGGFYLMGLNKFHFDERAFKDLPWKTKFLTKKITQLIAVANIHIMQLNTLMDLDSYSDLKRILKGFKANSAKLFQTIISIIASTKNYVHHRCIFIKLYHNNNYFNKGSPVGSTYYP